MKVYFDALNKRLIYIGSKASPSFWENHWNALDLNAKFSLSDMADDYVIKYTMKFLNKNSLIIEGGCGLGQNVFRLQSVGYRVVGIDYAKKTINSTKKIYPDLNLHCGNLEHLGYSNSIFDGYWSLGVIEHDYLSFEPILSEMSRVLKRNGFAFVVFPHMSLLRKIKAKLKCYLRWTNNPDLIKQFYQFAFSESPVIKIFEKYGFILVEKHPLDAVGGLERELPLGKLLAGRTIFSRGLSSFWNKAMPWFSGHIILLIFKKG